MLRINHLRNKLARGDAVIGTWSVIPSPVSVDIIAESGIDFIIIDAEHGPINFETAQNMVMACESRNVSPVVRVGGVIESEILRALEIGVHCVQIPNVSNSMQLNDAIRFSKYPPAGNRGFSPFTRACGYTSENSKEMHRIANESVLLATHVEGKEAIKNIGDILDIAGIDIVFIGMYDLSKAFGVPGEVDNPIVVDIAKELSCTINNSGKYPGTIVTNNRQLEQFIDYGYKYITYSVDCEMLLRTYREVYSSFIKLRDRR